MAIGQPTDLGFRPLYSLDLEGAVRTETKLFSDPIPLSLLERDYGIITRVEVPRGLILDDKPTPYVSLDVITTVKNPEVAETSVRGTTTKGTHATDTIPSMGKSYSAEAALFTHIQLLEELQQLYQKQHPPSQQ